MTRTAAFRCFLLLVLATAFLASPEGSIAADRVGRDSQVERILTADVTLSNVDAFKEQVRRDLPLGTKKGEVDAYLKRWNFRYDFFEPNPVYGRNGNSFQAVLQDIGYRLIFPVDLLIRIHLDGNDEVSEIFFRLDTETP